MKNSKISKIGKDEQFNKGKTLDADEDGSTADFSGGKQGAQRRGASLIMQAVAKAVQTTPGKSGKKATKPGSKSKPTSAKQKSDFKKSSKTPIPFKRNNGTEDGSDT